MAVHDLTGELRNPTATVAKFTPRSVADTMVEFFEDPVEGRFERPEHLRPIVQAYDLAIFKRSGEGAGLEVCAHAPPRSGKTELGLAALLTSAIVSPGLRHAYCAYNGARAASVRAKFESLAVKAGLRPYGAVDGPQFLAGGTEIRWVGVGEGLTGEGVNGLCLVDDYAKDAAAADSAAIRASTQAWFHSVVETRCEPGASIFVFATRWHVQDLASHCISLGFVDIRLPAVCDDEESDLLQRKLGEALWPSRRPLSFLARYRRDTRTWNSLFQGLPVGLSEQLFSEPHFWVDDPRSTGATLRWACGLDIAYVAKARADHSVILTGALDSDGKLYLTKALRSTLGFERFVPLAVTHGKGRTVQWFAGRNEMGAVKTLRDAGMRLRVKTAQGADKLARARTSGALAAWQEGRILLPDVGSADWVAPFIDVVTGWTGKPGEIDDDCDSLSALCDLLRMGGQGANAGAVDFRVPSLSGAVRFGPSPPARLRYMPVG